jgi:alkylated DNA repair dioxygenase AlkB
MSSSSSTRWPTSRFPISRCAASWRDDGWRSSANRTTGGRGAGAAFLLPLRARIAEWAGVDSEAFAMALINEYRPGAPIGWHRDAPQYGIVAGVSLLSACRMKFRPYRSPATASPTALRRSATHEIVLRRRSAYLMTQGRASVGMNITFRRWERLRYSITFRTLRSTAGG